MNFPTKSQAFALVLVLITLMLATTMTILFLGSVGSERRGVDLYCRGSQVKQLAGVAVNRVIGQINAATKEGSASQPVSWASQPGMVRTYAASGNAKSIYKLYSWDNLVEAGVGFNPSSDSEIPNASWQLTPAVYTDLNQIVNNVYPIVDPRAETVAGFSIDQGNPAVSSSGLRAPMPVKWMYVLEDGQMVVPTGGAGDLVRIPGATKDNPIVGRVAFWTDDETSKVNINTASEGTFWDWPKSGSRDDVQFAGNPPVRGEFQRTPGHPAMTSLSAVFPELLSADRWNSTTAFRSQLDDILALSPRIQGGGSRGGTYPVGSYYYDYEPAYKSLTPPGPITLDAERLFATADELWFRPDRSESPALKANLPHGVDEFRQRLFFLTANSRAPETTLFETPRISLWPVTWPYPSSYFTTRGGAPSALDPNTKSITSNPWMAAEEKLLAFCSTLNSASTDEQNKYRYYFQRQNPDSPTYDWTQIRRNQELVTYLSRELNQNLPGWGASLASKWGTTTADWIALNSFDFSRSMINQYTMNSLTQGLTYSYTGVAFRDAKIGNSTISKAVSEPNAFSVSPLRVELNGTPHVTQGAFPSLEEVAVMFFATERLEPVAPANPDDVKNPFKWKNLINPGGNATKEPYGSDQYDNLTTSDPSDDVGSRTTKMQAVMFLEFSKMNPGVYGYAPVFWVKVKGASFSVNGGGVGLPSSGGRVVQWNARVASPVPRVFAPLFAGGDANVAKTFSNSATGANVWTLVSDPISVNSNATTFSFGGSKITVEVYAAYSNNLNTDPTNDTDQLISTRDIDFSAWNGSTLPIPLAPRWTTFEASVSQPDPKLSTDKSTTEPRNTMWAYSEFSPAMQQLVTEPNVDQRDILTRTANAVPACYVYYGKDTNKATSKISPRLVFRTLSLSTRSKGSSKFFGEDGKDVFTGNADQYFEEGWTMITPYDTVISMVCDPDHGAAGDPRLERSASFVKIDLINGIGQPAAVFASKPATSGVVPYYPRTTLKAQLHQLGTPGRFPMATGYRILPKLNGSVIARYGSSVYLPDAGQMGGRTQTSGIVGAEFGAKGTLPSGDWTTMPGNSIDGGYLARPDQEFQCMAVDSSDTTRMFVPYFLKYGSYESASANYFSPNREVPSPVLLGSLPSSTTNGWQTLAFCPNPADVGHPGLRTPPDHLLLDLFWMPVAEPYPISDRFSTAGKINLNYAIMPFSYIHRKTGLHALMKATSITALPDTAAQNYKSHYFMRQNSTRTRFSINVEETLKGFDAKFDSGDLFRSASQICEMYLVPTGETYTSTKSSFWNGKKLTADNAREEPYDHLYSRVTTKSNTYTVHWRAQVLQKPSREDPETWDESKKRVVSDLRGSTAIERYINPNASDIEDYATKTNAEPLSKYYKWRVVSENYFQP